MSGGSSRSSEEACAFSTAQQPIRQSCATSLFRDTHWKCLVLCLSVYLCLSVVIWCHIDNQFVVKQRDDNDVLQKMSFCRSNYVYIPLVFAMLAYFVYLLECWNCHTRVELLHKLDTSLVNEYIKDMQDAMPFIWWEVVCYHYLRRAQNVTRYRNGNASTMTQANYERVNSCIANNAFNFAQAGCRDASRQVYGLENFAATKIRFSKSFSFYNDAAEAEFEHQRSSFFHENESRDDYMECREGMDLLDLHMPEYLIAVRDCKIAPWYLSHQVFLLLSVFLFSWPLRVLIEYKTAYLHYHVHKVFGHHYVATDESQLICGSRPVNAHRRATSITSTELDFFLRNNLQQLPSYSEALLMPLPTLPKDEDVFSSRPIDRLIENEAMQKLVPLSRSRTIGNWCCDREQTNAKTIRRLSLPWFTGARRELSRSNASDSYIVGYCQQNAQKLTASSIIIEEKTTSANHPSATAMQEILPDYETARLLPKIIISKLQRHSRHLINGSLRRSVTSKLRRLRRSRSEALFSRLTTRECSLLIRSRSEFQHGHLIEHDQLSTVEKLCMKGSTSCEGNSDAVENVVQNAASLNPGNLASCSDFLFYV